MPKLTEITISLQKRNDQRVQEVIHWPILQDTGKMLLVETPEGERWVPKSDVLSFHKTGYWYCKDEGHVRCGVEHVEMLIERLTQVFGPLVAEVHYVKKVSEKAGRYEVKVVGVDAWGDQCPARGAAPKMLWAHRRVTLPFAQILERDGTRYAPTWLFKKSLEDGDRLFREVRLAANIAACVRAAAEKVIAHGK